MLSVKNIIYLVLTFAAVDAEGLDPLAVAPDLASLISAIFFGATKFTDGPSNAEPPGFEAILTLEDD